MSRLAAAALVAGSMVVIGGCRSMPVYPWVDPQTALREMADRAARLTTVEGECRVLLTDEQGDTIRLDAALVAQPPEQLRLRAWKLGHVAFDLLLTADDLWLVAPDERVTADTLKAGPFVEAWVLAVTGLPSGDVRVEDAGGPEFTIVGRSSGGGTTRAVIDRATLLPVRYTLLDDVGAVIYTLDLDRYRDVDGIAWPTRLAGHAAGRTFVLEMRDPRFNQQPAPAAFEPPPGATRAGG